VSDIDDIRAVIAAYGQAGTHRSPDEYVALFDDDVVWAPPGGEPVRTRDGIRERISATFARPLPDGATSTMTAETIDIEGTLATVVAHLLAVAPDGQGGTVTRADNTALFVLRKREDGWRIARQVVNSRLRT
jgi:uncharacterized protein (TIGR02246 family)